MAKELSRGEWYSLLKTTDKLIGNIDKIKEDLREVATTLFLQGTSELLGEE